MLPGRTPQSKKSVQVRYSADQRKVSVIRLFTWSLAGPEQRMGEKAAAAMLGFRQSDVSAEAQGRVGERCEATGLARSLLAFPARRCRNGNHWAHRCSVCETVPLRISLPLTLFHRSLPWV